jgi:hypothetical protein
VTLNRIEAEYTLKMAYAERDACEAEKKWANSSLKEALLRKKLAHLRSKKAEKKFNKAALAVGNARYIIERSGHAGIFDQMSQQTHKDVHVKTCGRELSDFLGVTSASLYSRVSFR